MTGINMHTHHPHIHAHARAHTHAWQLRWLIHLLGLSLTHAQCVRHYACTQYQHMEKCIIASNCLQFNIYHCKSNNHVQERITEKECVRYNSRRSAFWKQNKDIFQYFHCLKIKTIQTKTKQKTNLTYTVRYSSAVNQSCLHVFGFDLHL